jgi:hypothetical protein
MATKSDILKRRNSELLQPRAAESVQIVVPRAGGSLRVVTALTGRDRDMFGNPSERDVGLHAAQLLQRGLGEFDVARHRRGCGQHAVSPGEVCALTDPLARETHRLVEIAADELGVGDNDAGDRCEWITRAQS